MRQRTIWLSTLGLRAAVTSMFGRNPGTRRRYWLADATEKGLAQSYGLMVNYLYDLDHIERNHEAYAGSRIVAASSAVRRLVRKASAELVPVAGGRA